MDGPVAARASGWRVVITPFPPLGSRTGDRVSGCEEAVYSCIVYLPPPPTSQDFSRANQCSWPGVSRSHPGGAAPFS